MADKIQLSERHRRFAEGILSGKTYGQAYMAAGYGCKSLNVASANATRLLKNAKYQINEYIREKQEEDRQLNQIRLSRMAGQAIKALLEIVDSGKDEKAKVSASKDILDRAGYKPADKIEHSGDTTIHIKKEIIDSGSED